jgi:hypothetical protein
MQGFVKLKVKLAMAQNTKNSTTLFGNGIRKEFTRAIFLELPKGDRISSAFKVSMKYDFAVTFFIAKWCNGSTHAFDA